MPPKGTPPDRKVVATNRQARRDFEVIETVEAGLVLRGSEVKSLREASVRISDSYARVIGDEAWLIGVYIAPYSHASEETGHEPDRDRKLLLHRKQIDRLRAIVDQQRLVLVPLSLYFTGGRAKLEIGLAKPRRQFDKRQAVAKRDADLEARRALAQRTRDASSS